MAAYNPFPKAYDMVNNPYSEIHDFFIPFDLIRNPESQLESTGDTDAFGPDETFQGDNLYTVAEYYWIQFWVELSSEQVPEYTQFLEHYAQSQKEAGRHPRPINNRVTPLRDWLSERGRVNQATAVLVVLSLLFLIVCALNLTGLLMAKFMSRSQVLGIQRALGATRGQVFLLHLLECELLAIFGGLLGLGVSYLAMGALRGMAGRFISGTVFSPDWFTFLSALFFSLFVGVLAGFYPSWRACRVAPAIQIKL